MRTMTGSIAGVILAGGKSMRMGGGDKGLLQLNGTSMLARIISRFRPQVTDLALNANGDPRRFAGFGLPVVADTFGDHAGPLAGVLAGLYWAHDLHTHIVTLPSDTPLLPADLVTRLAVVNDGAENRIVLANTAHGRQPVIGLWPVTLIGALEASLEAGKAKVSEFIDGHDSRVAEFPLLAGDVDPFFNVNTPEDLEQVRKIISEES